MLVVDIKEGRTLPSFLAKNKVVLKSWLIGYLSDRSLTEVSGAAGINRLRREIEDQFNNLLFPDGARKIKGRPFRRICGPMNVQPHNFRRPSRLAADLEERLHAWLKNACKLAPQHWSKHLLALSSWNWKRRSWRTPEPFPRSRNGGWISPCNQCESAHITNHFAPAFSSWPCRRSDGKKRCPKGLIVNSRRWKILWASISLIICCHCNSDTWLGAEPIRATLKRPRE